MPRRRQRRGRRDRRKGLRDSDFDKRNVFINIPFDAPYEDCYIALVAGLVGLGLYPRSVLELSPSRSQLERIVQRLKSCRYSLHDLCRVELSAGKYPRFNMPFEAGLATALEIDDRAAHERYLLERVRYRLARTCSDLNGINPQIHRGGPLGVLRAVTNLFGRAEGIVGVKHLRPIYNQLRREAATIKRTYGSLFERRSFGELVVAARTITEQAKRTWRLSAP